MGVVVRGKRNRKVDLTGAPQPGIHEAAVGAAFGGEDLREVLVLHGGPIDMDRVLSGPGTLWVCRSGFRREPLVELAAPIFHGLAAGEGVHAEEGRLLVLLAGEVGHEAGLEAIAAQGDGAAEVFSRRSAMRTW
jgi:hypothetical protein